MKKVEGEFELSRSVFVVPSLDGRDKGRVILSRKRERELVSLASRSMWNSTAGLEFSGEIK